MPLIIMIVVGVGVGLLWFFGHTAIAIGIIAALLMHNAISIWLRS